MSHIPQFGHAASSAGDLLASPNFGVCGGTRWVIVEVAILKYFVLECCDACPIYKSETFSNIFISSMKRFLSDRFRLEYNQFE